VGVESAAEEEERGSLKGEVRTAYSWIGGVLCGVVWPLVSRAENGVRWKDAHRAGAAAGGNQLPAHQGDATPDEGW